MPRHPRDSRLQAFLFILLLVGQEVQKIQAMRPESIAGNIAAGGSGNSFQVGAHASFFGRDSFNKSRSGLFRNQAERQARIAQLADILRKVTGLTVRGQGDETTNSTANAQQLCKSPDWPEQIEKLKVQLAKVKSHTESIMNDLKAHPKGKKHDSWARKEATAIIKEARALEPCMELEKKGHLQNKEQTPLDADLKQLMENGIDVRPMPTPRERKYIDEVYAGGISAARSALFSTTTAINYQQDSNCNLEPRREKPIWDGFVKKPTCGFEDCAIPELNVKNFPTSVTDGLDKCPGELGAQSIEAFGSAEWHGCGGRMYGTTLSCKLGKGRSVCCCKPGLLNGSPEDVERNKGCTAKCTKPQAEHQRTIAHRIDLVADEMFGQDCDYGATVGGFYHLASRIRAAQEKILYKRASGLQINMAEEIDQQQTDATETAASVLVEMEEDRGSLLELDELRDMDALTIVVIIVIIIILIILCVTMPDLCIFIWILSIIQR